MRAERGILPPEPTVLILSPQPGRAVRHQHVNRQVAAPGRADRILRFDRKYSEVL
jgi:hypothetical protein